MEIINISNYKETRFSTGVALGNFDGIHLGHQQLIKTMIEESKKLGLKSSLLLFEKHTKATINNKQPKVITTNDQKFKIAKDLGIDIIYIIDFDKKIMELSGEKFIQDIVINKMNSKLLVVGFDYKFGYKASGDSKFLLELGKKYNIQVRVIDPIFDGKEIIGSTGIRKLIMQGNITKANGILGRNYSIMGKVISGSNRGNKLGFPTANIEANHNNVIPKPGVYKTNTIIDGKRYTSATNIGYNPTFGGKVLKIETHILDFKSNIYGKTIEIEFLSFLRDDMKFANIDGLINQLNTDIDRIKSQY